MKRSTIIFQFLFLFLSLSVKAYDYQTIYSHRQLMFTCQSGDISVIKIDSVDFKTDSVFYPLKGVQQMGTNCYTPHGETWLGGKIIILPRWNYYSNENGDTIKFKTDATLNECWTMYAKGNIEVTATVQKWDTLNFLGLTDSVKTIGLHVFDSTMKPIAHNLEGVTLQFSKRYGWVKTINLLSLPVFDQTGLTSNKLTEQNLVGLTNPKTGLQNLTQFDAFDFQPGDEIHTLSTETPFSNTVVLTKTITKYLGKENLLNAIKYLVDRETTILNLYKDTVFRTKYNHISDKQLIVSNADFDNLPGVPFFTKGLDSYAFTTVMTNDEKWGYIPAYSKLDNGCWRPSTTDPKLLEYYKKGLGGPYGEINFIEYPDHESSKIHIDLVYYKKGSQTWGTPLVLTGINQTEQNRNIFVYPNPTKESISISLDKLTEPCIFEMLDLRGIVILRTEVELTRNSVNLDKVSNGLYMYRLLNKGKIVKTGKIVKL